MTLGNLAKPVFVASILVFSIIGLGFIIQDVSADHGEDPGITTPVVAGLNTITFRDISNKDPYTSTITVDDSGAKGGSLTINFEDLDSNLDSTFIDMLNVTANSTTSGPAKATVKLTETSINSGIFTGTLFLSTTETVDDTLQVSEGDKISVIDEEDNNVARFSAQVNVINPGNVKITDDFIDPNSVFNGPFLQVSHGVNIALIDGATIDQANPPVITISYANLDLLGFDPSLLSMYYNPDPFDVFTPLPGVPEAVCDLIPGVWDPIAMLCSTVITNDGGWEQIRDPALVDPINDLSYDPVGKTISSDVANTDWGMNGNSIFGPAFGECCPTGATFMLAFDTGSIGGGGGGGLVRPGFVVNALAGANVISSFFGKGGASGDFTGGSKNGPAKPIVTSGTVNNLSDESIGFVQQGITSDSESVSTSKSLDSTQNVAIGKDLTFEYNVYENKGPERIVHSTMYFFDAQMMDANDRIDVSKSETYIMFQKGKPVKVVDPYGYFEKANFELSAIDTYNAALKYDITFGKPMPESHIVLRTWDTEKYSTDTLFKNAVVVDENSILDNDPPSKDNEPLTQSEFEASPFLDTQFENELLQEETVTKTGFPGIPLWVKNNAMWWHEKQIDDEDFVAGIQYMINEELITIPETEVTSSTSDEIPSWVSNIAGYWSNDQIPDEEFVQAMQWLVSNGVMEV